MKRHSKISLEAAHLTYSFLVPTGVVELPEETGKAAASTPVPWAVHTDKRERRQGEVGQEIGYYRCKVT